MTSKNRNALVHGAYSSDFILSWEDPEAFSELMSELASEYQPQGQSEKGIVQDIAILIWRKNRINRLLQLSCYQSEFAHVAETSGKRTVKGIRRALDKRSALDEDQKERLTIAISQLSEAASLLAADISGKDKGDSRSRTRRHIASVQSELAKVFPLGEKVAELLDPQKLFDVAPLLEANRKAIELEARLDSQIDKKIQRLVIIREFKRQYAGKDAKLIEYQPRTAKPTPAVIVGKTIGSITKFGGGATRWTGNTSNAADIDNDNEDNDDDPEDFATDEEYEDYKKDKENKRND